jgi:hypothetical protein
LWASRTLRTGVSSSAAAAAHSNVSANQLLLLWRSVLPLGEELVHLQKLPRQDSRWPLNLYNIRLFLVRKFEQKQAKD